MMTEEERNFSALVVGICGILGFAILLGALIFGGKAKADDLKEWQNWGAYPYANSETEALSDAKLDFALKSFGWGADLRVAAKAAVRANSAGTRIFLDPADSLVAMMSGGSHPHAMKGVKVAEIPVSVPNRRGIVQAATARSWQFEYAGQTYELILPDVCYNWSYRLVEQKRFQLECARVVFEPGKLGLKPDDVIKIGVFSKNGLNNTCWGFEKENGPTRGPLQPCGAKCNWGNVETAVRRMSGGKMRAYQTFELPVSECGKECGIILPLAVVTDTTVTAICIHRGSLVSDAVGITKEDWHGQDSYFLAKGVAKQPQLWLKKWLRQ